MDIGFNPANWYWIVGSDTTRVYSSAIATYVPTRDPTYMAWLAVGGEPSRIASEQDLWDYLNGRVLNGTQATSTSTDAAKEQRIDQQLTEAAWQALFSLQNQVLVLQGNPTITRDQYLTRVKGLMK